MSQSQFGLFDHKPEPLKPEPPPREVASSSVESYAELKESGKLRRDHLHVLRSLDDYSSFHLPSQPTARELHAWMHECGRCGPDPNEVKPRLTELEEEGFIHKCPEEKKRHCSVTGKRVFTWVLTPKGEAAVTLLNKQAMRPIE
jgi:hypothetical protein